MTFGLCLSTNASSLCASAGMVKSVPVMRSAFAPVRDRRLMEILENRHMVHTSLTNKTMSCIARAVPGTNKNHYFYKVF